MASGRQIHYGEGAFSLSPLLTREGIEGRFWSDLPFHKTAVMNEPQMNTDKHG